jgi:threonylcarbamoyladenosine tRNA methylthiotransferase MtaB
MSQSTQALDVLTFGCRLNAFESEVMRRNALSLGLVDAVIVNTCAVTAEAVRQAEQAIRRARRERPRTRIVVTGCAAQLEPQRFAAMGEVDLVLGNREKLHNDAFASASGVRVSDIMGLRETAAHMIASFSERARAFVEVQNGCDHRCTFCIIPFARGPSRSVAIADVVRQVRALVESGFAEIVLTGVDLTAYGADLPGAPRLGQLVCEVLERVPALTRLRLSSLDAAEVDPLLLELFSGEKRLMPHLHLSLQSGDDTILKRMKRRHSRAQAVALCSELRMRRPDIAFGADLIAGFPTESETMFESTLALIDECVLAYTHVFPFSARRGTPAARMPRLDGKVVRERARRLRERGATVRASYLREQVGRLKDVLVEKGRAGRSEDYAPVTLDRDTKPGHIVRARVTSSDGTRLLAAVCR